MHSRNKQRGKYIVIEGGEGLGKSTQATLLADHLGAVLTREPGGTGIGSEIRAITHDPTHTSLTPMATLLLMTADRAQHVAEVIEPTIEAGRHVVSDRSWVSSLVYQGIVGNVGSDTVHHVTELAIGQYAIPDMLIIMTAPWDLIIERRHSAGRPTDRFELMDEDFHKRVNDTYCEVASELGAIVIDASGGVDEVQNQIRSVIDV